MCIRDRRCAYKLQNTQTYDQSCKKRPSLLWLAIGWSSHSIARPGILIAVLARMHGKRYNYCSLQNLEMTILGIFHNSATTRLLNIFPISTSFVTMSNNSDSVFHSTHLESTIGPNSEGAPPMHLLKAQPSPWPSFSFDTSNLTARPVSAVRPARERLFPSRPQLDKLLFY